MKLLAMEFFIRWFIYICHEIIEVFEIFDVERRKWWFTRFLYVNKTGVACIFENNYTGSATYA